MTVAVRVTGVLLAAGRGTRFDPSGVRLKLLEPAARGPHVGVPLAVAAARSLRGAVHEVVAVVAPPVDEPTRRLHALLQDEGCRLVVNPRAAEGQATSIACGIGAAGSADGWVIALADMPAIQPATARRIEAIVRAERAPRIWWSWAAPRRRRRPSCRSGSGPLAAGTETALPDYTVDGPASLTTAPPTNGGSPITAIWAGDVNGHGLEDICWADWTGASLDGGFQLLWDDGN